MIETKRLLLIPVDCEILDSLLESDKSFLNRYGFINDGGEFLNPSPDYLHKIRQRLIDYPEEYPLAVDYLIVIKEIKTVIGTIYYKNLPNKDGVSEIGYGMNPKYEGHGYMSEALLSMLKLGKENSIITVTADTVRGNIKSQKVLIRCGFSLVKEEENKLWFSKTL